MVLSLVWVSGRQAHCVGNSLIIRQYIFIMIRFIGVLDLSELATGGFRKKKLLRSLIPFG